MDNGTISTDFAKMGIGVVGSLQDNRLFGGALTISLPPLFVDMSNFRQLSDTQECWADASTDQSIVVEILAHDDEVADTECAAFYWEDIAECNDADAADDSVITSPSKEVTSEMSDLFSGAPDSTVAAPSCWILSGVQGVAKFKDAAKNTVVVHVAVIRLPCVDSDIVLHYNQPLAINEESSSAVVANATPTGTAEQGAELFFAMLKSLKVRDWGLFSSPAEEEAGDEGAFVAAAG
mmetsp:Transcript_70512/g.146828  ORF Transcript_70512/g.146828 Transcript_70512/m.146828 type:complete len:236 (+) Transcript_70512:164-871(+)